MSSILSKVFSALQKLVCGSSSDKPEQHKPGQQQPGYPPHKPQQSHPQKPSSGGHPPPKPSSPPHKPQYQGGKDPNVINQSNEHYVSLRAEASEHGRKMAEAFEESHQAYAGGDGARAKELSNAGKDHQRKMEQLNKQASDWIYVENNKDSQPHEIDLHGLYVKEAIAHTDSALETAKRRGDSEVHLIVGKGLHSGSKGAKIKPAIEELMQKHQLVAELDPENAGVLIVHINGGGSSRGVGPDEISRRLDREDESCTIM